MEATPRELRIYVAQDGKRPFREWLDSLKDIKAVTKIERRLERLEKGNFGDVKRAQQYWSDYRRTESGNK